ncbi:MAG: hypothetical protein IPN15_08395 [Saprospiraceae bacterium]|nr:hypothetical protein [Candidatus Vicinibacter affinis]MBK8642218.1 hypothetical protein [Candidatus Vicinibacter affinis]
MAQIESIRYSATGKDFTIEIKFEKEDYGIPFRVEIYGYASADKTQIEEDWELISTIDDITGTEKIHYIIEPYDFEKNYLNKNYLKIHFKASLFKEVGTCMGVPEII